MKKLIANYLIEMVDDQDAQEYLRSRLANEEEGYAEFHAADNSFTGASTYAFTLMFIDRPLFTVFGSIAFIYMIASIVANLFIN